MPLQIVFTNCDDSEVQAEIRKRCQEMFRHVPDEWTVRIAASHDGALWKMTISGPSHFTYALDLARDTGEQNPDFVATAIKQAVVGELSG